MLKLVSVLLGGVKVTCFDAFGKDALTLGSGERRWGMGRRLEVKTLVYFEFQWTE
jgi:hypothetical protein